MTDNPTYSLMGGSVPHPDPTILTTEALQRAISTLRESIALQIKHESESRIAADLNLQSHVDLQQNIRNEKFEAVAREMSLVEDSRVEQKQDALASLAAALSAAKEAVKEQTTASALSINKSENATNEQLKQLTVTFTTAIEGVNRTIIDLKERVGKNESVQAAQGGVGEGKEQNQGLVFNIIMGLVAIGSLVIAFVAR